MDRTKNCKEKEKMNGTVIVEVVLLTIKKLETDFFVVVTFVSLADIESEIFNTKKKVSFKNLKTVSVSV